MFGQLFLMRFCWLFFLKEKQHVCLLLYVLFKARNDDVLRLPGIF